MERLRPRDVFYWETKFEGPIPGVWRHSRGGEVIRLVRLRQPTFSRRKKGVDEPSRTYLFLKLIDLLIFGGECWTTALSMVERDNSGSRLLLCGRYG